MKQYKHIYIYIYEHLPLAKRLASFILLTNYFCRSVTTVQIAGCRLRVKGLGFKVRGLGVQDVGVIKVRG